MSYEHKENRLHKRVYRVELLTLVLLAITIVALTSLIYIHAELNRRRPIILESSEGIMVLLQAELDRRTEDRFHGADMDVWIERLREINPDLVLPDWRPEVPEPDA